MLGRRLRDVQNGSARGDGEDRKPPRRDAAHGCAANQLDHRSQRRIEERPDRGDHPVRSALSGEVQAL